MSSLGVKAAHDSGATESVIDALRSTAGATPIRLLPTVRTRGLEAEVAERLSGVELLDPLSDEQRFAELAASADVVLATDPSERAELVAESCGPQALARQLALWQNTVPSGRRDVAQNDAAASAMCSIFAFRTGRLRAGWRPKPHDGEIHNRSSPTTRAQSAARSRIFLTVSIP